MIIDTIDNIMNYACLGPNFKTAATYIAEGKYKELPLGKTLVDGNSVFCVVSEAEIAAVPENWEMHRKYADIQIPIEGSEIVGYFPISELKEKVYFPEGKDIAFVKGYKGQDLIIKENDFMILLPQDVHRPGCPSPLSKKIKKVVIKVAL